MDIGTSPGAPPWTMYVGGNVNSKECYRLFDRRPEFPAPLFRKRSSDVARLRLGAVSPAARDARTPADRIGVGRHAAHGATAFGTFIPEGAVRDMPAVGSRASGQRTSAQTSGASAT